MSLDVSLCLPDKEVPCICGCCWNEHTRIFREELYTSNITHNLNRMAQEANLYKALWRPEEIGITKAGELIPLLRAGLDNLMAAPVHFAQLNAENGWGTYKHFVQFVAEYLAACEATPDAEVHVSR